MQDAQEAFASPETQRMVRAYVAALSRDRAAVDDLAQEVFVRALERIHRLHDPKDPGPFLRGISRLVVREHFRAVKRDRIYNEAIIDAMSRDGKNVFDGVRDRELHEQLSAAISGVPLVARRMLEMRYYEGLNASQIAERFGVRAGAVRATLMRVRERLRKALQHH